jgi:hypothetical protein
MRFYRKRRNTFVLLEILIAFGLVALCIFPLVSSQVKILTAQKELHSRLEKQRLANLSFSKTVEQLYRGEITLDQLDATSESIREKEAKVILKLSYGPYDYYLYAEKT